MLLSAICKMSANSHNRKRCGVLIDIWTYKVTYYKSEFCHKKTFRTLVFRTLFSCSYLLDGLKRTKIAHSLHQYSIKF